ncbi:MAG TPA: membrane protein insertase YidC [Allosphingosinicella sp.]|nr:membrane protein insertase YidC [Allosphingosinicella sp.]
MNGNKNMILAVVLSAIVLFGWGFISQRYFPTANPPVTRIEKGREVATPQPQASPAPNAPAAVRDRALVIGESPRVAIQTPRLAGSINLRGARLDDLVLTDQRETIAANSPPVRLFSPSGTPGAYFASFGWSGQGAALPGPDTLWQASGTRLSPETPVTLSWNNNQGQIFQILLSVDRDYLFTAEQRIVNRGAGPVAARPFALVSRTGPSLDPSSWTTHTGPIGVFDGAANYDVDFTNLDGAEPGFFGRLFGTQARAGPNYYDSTGGWVGFGDKYWLAALIPDQGARVHAGFRSGGNNHYQADIEGQPAVVGPGQAHRATVRLFAGAKEMSLLRHYTNDLGIQRLDKAIDWGWFEWFMRPIFSLLLWLYSVIGNFGVAIICLTLIVRTLLFPIAQRQFRSMAAMRAIQPKMKAIQERYADDRMTMQQEVMKLYKEEKVNPAAGCLPIFLQIPVFYALYKVLMISVEMRHKPFVLWIRDLSAPDPLTPVNLFGFLPFTPPHILAIGVLPILLGVTMWLQMRLQPQAPDPVQRQIFALMPWVLMFVMASFAAGLQLYWVTNNILTIAQQKWLYSRHPGLQAQAAK